MPLIISGVFAICVLSPPLAFAEDPRWWHQPDVQRALALRVDQITALDQEYDRTLPERLRTRQRLDIADRRIAAVLMEGNVSDDAMSALVLHAETLRARRNVARTMLLLRLRRVLTPAQYRRLEAIARDKNASASAR
jgi:Spy/CpxP family protein refolding chaperone